jgi:L-fuconolactonase
VTGAAGPPRVDAHQHYWRIARGDYGWLTPALRPIYRDFGPEDLRPHLERAGITRTVLVQAAPTEAETRHLLDVAGQTPGVAAVVGWVDLAAPDAPGRLAALAGDARLRGIRPMIHDIADDDWMLGDALAPALRALPELGLTFDALVRPRHLGRLRRLLERHPRLRVVIDHGAKPDIAGWGADRTRYAAWAEAMAGLARDTGARCKLSGLITEAAPGWRAADLRPYVDHLLACFGPERLMWGSDWPVVILGGGYDAWWDASQGLLAGLAGDARAAVLGGTAAACYGL